MAEPRDINDDEMRVSREDDYLRGSTVLLDGEEVLVERVGTGSEAWDYIGDRMRRRRPDSHRVIEGDR